MRKYEENIEVVDPQLKNNPELVDLLNIVIFAFYCKYPNEFNKYFNLNNFKKVELNENIIINLFKCRNYNEIIDLFLDNI